MGNDIKNKKYSLAAFLGDKGMGQLDIKDLEVDLASYVVEVKLEETVAKTVGIEKRILHSGWDSKDLCRDEEMVRYLTIIGQLQFQLGKIYV